MGLRHEQHKHTFWYIAEDVELMQTWTDLVCFAVICSVYIDLQSFAALLKSPVPDLQ